MNKLITSLGLVLCVGLVGCAETPENEVKIAEVTSSMVRNPDEVTCRAVVRTGTRIGSKKCMTNRAWKQAAQDGREATETIQRKSTMTVHSVQGGN